MRTCPDLKKGKDMGKKTAAVNTASVETSLALKLPLVSLEIVPETQEMRTRGLLVCWTLELN
jgi:hypothetical protein